MTEFYASIHILADAPDIETDAETYPSLTFRQAPGDVQGSLTVSITGDSNERLAFALALREAAAFVAQWTPEQGRAASVADADV